MAKSQNRVEFQIGYSVDKSGLEQMQSMFQQIANKAQEPGKKISDGLKKAGETAATLDKILERTFNSDLGTLNVTKFNQELAKSNLTLKDVKNNLVAEGNLGATAYNKLTQAILGTNQQLRESNKLLDSMAKSFKNVLTWGVASSVFNSVTASIQNAYVYAKQLNSSLNDIRIVTDKSAESMEKFAIQANNAAKNLGASTLDYSNAALIYYQQGLSDEEAQARAETTVKAANITGQTGEAVSEQLTAVWNGYKVTAEETELYVDKLAAVAATTAADLEELSVGMSKVASAASTMGVDFDDLNAQMATIVSVTRQAPESVGTALKTIYARLGDLKVDGVDEFGVKLGEVTKNLQTMGIEILDEQGNMRDMTSVMTEVAEKWNTWTEAQKQAAAIAMAGKRQYNNLMALFENWDMYSKALETSADAMGTLQHQQDIYMESTSAKLKTLKATWQDLYDGLIDDDEINAGIDALTNLVQVFDNFIDSFGGGIKSIAGFGAVIANIFSKQISNGITNVIQQATTLSNNLDLARTKAEAFSLGAAKAENPTPTDLGVQANTQDQLKTAQEIYAVRHGINEEQSQSLIANQKMKGDLVEQKTIIEETIKKTQGRILGEQQLNKLLQLDVASLQEEVEKTQNLVTTNKEVYQTEQTAYSTIQKTLKETKSLQKAKENITKAAEKIPGIDQKALNQLLEQCTKSKDLFKVKQQILDLAKQGLSVDKEAVEESERESNAINKVYEAKTQIYDIDQQIKNKEIEIAETLEQASMGTRVTQMVTAVTSALGTMAMAWSSVSSLMQTFEDENASVEDKLTQFIMTLTMTGPMIFSTFKKINDLYNASAILKQKDVILSNIQLAAESKLTGAKTKEAVVTALKNAAEENSVELNSAQLAQLTALILGTEGETTAREHATTATLAQAAAQKVLNAAMAINPITAAIMALAVLAAGISFAVKQQEKLAQATIDANNEQIERVNKIQEETDANKELCDSFEDLYSQYKQGKVEKQALYEVTDKICDAYDLEDGYIAKLTGDYDELNKKIREKRELELNNTIQETENEITAAGSNLYNLNKQSKYGASRSNSQGINYAAIDFGPGMMFSDDIDVAKKLSERVTMATSSGQYGSFSAMMKTDDPKKMLQTYDEINEAILDMEKEYQEAGKFVELQSSEVYQSAKAWLGEMHDGMEEYRTSLEELNNYETQRTFLQNDLLDVNNLTDYETKIAQIREDLTNIYGDGEESQEKISSIIDTYIGGLNNEFLQTERSLEKLREEGKLTEEDFKEIEKWSNEDKKLLFTGKIDWNVPHTLEEVQKQKDFIQNELSNEDLTVVASLRTKLTSDKKLSKKELEEAAGEESTLSQDYEANLYDFDNQSQLDQVEILNDIVNQKIAANQRYLDNLKEQKEEEKKILEDNIVTYQKEADTAKGEAEEYAKAHGKLARVKDEEGKWTQEYHYIFDSEEEQKEYDGLIAKQKEFEDAVVSTEDAVKELNEELKVGALADEFDNKIFENLITGIDGVISKAEVLSDLASKIGEDWTIAGKDIQEFALNFPDLLDAQENYNILQDGSLQLTEQGKIAYQEMAESRKEQLLAENEAYQIELQKQADIQKANAEYHQKRAQRLREYLNGEKNAADTEAGLAQDLTEYKQDLADAIAQGDADLTNQILENLDKSAKQAQIDCQNEWDYWCSVGDAALKAGLAYTNHEFKPINSPLDKGFAGGHVQATQVQAHGQVDSYISSLSDEKILNQIKVEEEAAIKAQNEYATYVSKKMAANSAVQTAIAGFDNAGKGKSKSGREKENKEEIRPEIDYLHKYRKAIEETERALKNLRKEKENLRGENLVKALSKENKILEKQRKQYEKLNDAILKGPDHAINGKDDPSEVDSIGKEKYLLQEVGAKFNSDNNVSNYAHIQEKLRDQYNAAIRAYNASGKSNDDEEKLNKAKIYYDEMIKVLKNYEDHVKEYNDNLEKIEEARLQEIANNLSKFETKIKLKHDKQALKREIIEFQKSVNEDIQAAYKDYEVEVDVQVALGNTYAKDIKIDQKAIKKAQEDIERFNNGEDGKYYATIDLAKEALVEAQKKQIEDANNLKQAYQDAWDAYLDGIDQAIEQHETLYKEFDRIDDELEHQGQLIELVWGEEAYDLRDKFYESQHKSSLNRMASLKNDAETYKNLLQASFDKTGHSLNNMFNWNEDEKKYYEQWREAQAGIREEVEKDIQTLKDKYDNAIKSTLRNLEKQLTGGRLEDVESEWERITKQADKYYDDVEKSYEIQTLANKWDKEITSTKNLKAQQKLKKIRDEEIKMLREKDKLTSYDIKKAELRYQLELKQMALEDARNNKTSMKLTRNAEGNWSYQYVANEEDTNDKEQDYLDTWHELYELSSDAYSKNLEEIQDLDKTYIENLRALSEKRQNNLIDETEYQNKLKKLNEEYYADYAALAEENNQYINDLKVHSAGLNQTIYEQDVTAYENMTLKQQELIDNLKDHAIESYKDIGTAISENIDGIGVNATKVIEQLQPIESSAQKLVDLWNNDNGKSVKSATDAATDALVGADNSYITGLQDIENESGEVFYGDDGKSGIIGNMTALTNETVNAKKAVHDLNEKMKTKMPKMKKRVENLKSKWEEANNSIQDNITSLKDYLKMLNNIETPKKIEIITEYSYVDTSGAKGGSSGGSGSTGSGVADLGSNGGNTSNGNPKLSGSASSAYKIIDDPNGAKGQTKIVLNYDKVEELKKKISNSTIDPDQRKRYEQELKELQNAIAQQETLYGSKAVYIQDNDSAKTKNKELKKFAQSRGFEKFATGGYTGTWGDDEGRLAMLHQKELVLNAEDTENFLSGISMIRDMSSLNGSINNSILKAISNMMLSLSGINTGLIGGATTDNSSSNTTFNITAEFPNAENVNDIREAILSLPNLASQFKGQRLK